jgi:mannose-6-phosphate isomerase-like protein (cupin superfamily)
MLPTFNIPPVGPRQGKVWGTTQLVFAFNSTEAHYIQCVAGGYCSRHKHEHKWNRFLVLSGALTVRIFRDGGGVDETELTAGQTTDVPPGVEHQFEADEPTTAVEFYWVPLEPLDIERITLGGLND